MGDGEWTRGGQIVAVESPWVRLVCERWVDDRGAELDYWRAERAHSVVAVPLWRGRVLLPPPQFRPGVGRLTLDLPGGRVPAGAAPEAAAVALLGKELGADPAAVLSVAPLGERGWVINSSFSNQLLFGVVARLDDAAELGAPAVRQVPATREGALALLRELECLQCRAVLLEWLLTLG